MKENQSKKSTITFNEIRDLIPFSVDEFSNYMNEIFKDLLLKTENVDCIPSSKKTQLKEKGISNYLFDIYLNISPFIADRIFFSFDKDKDLLLSQKEFVTGMSKLYSGSFEETQEAIFSIYDFKGCGTVNKSDIKLVMSYLPFRDECDIDYKTQLKGVSDIEAMIQKTFGDKNSITFDEFKKIIREKIEPFIYLITYLFTNTPFDEFGIRASRAKKNKKMAQPLKKNHSMFAPSAPLPFPNTSMVPFKITSALEKLLKGDDDTSHNNNNKKPVQGTEEIKIPKKHCISPRQKEAYNLSPVKNYSKTHQKKQMSVSNLIPIDDFYLEISSDQYEDYTFRYDETSKGKVLNKYYIALYKKDIFTFTSEMKSDCVEIINLTGCYIDESPAGTTPIVVNKVSYFPLTIHFSSNVKYVYYFSSANEREKWESGINKLLNIEKCEKYYSFTEELGQGRFGLVKKGIELSTNKVVAVKIINKIELKASVLDMIYRELNYMKRMKHPYIVKVYNSFEDVKYIYIVMEYFEGGDLSDYISSHPKNVSDHDAAVILHYLSSTVKYLNAYGIIHRDFKLENILLVKKNDLSIIKIIDFGIAITLGAEELCKEVACTIVYAAPEVLLEEGYNKEVDIWSIGVILYLLVAGTFPFDDPELNNTKITKKIIYSELDFPKETFGKKPKALINLLDHFLDKNPSKRIKVDEILKNEWVEKNIK